MTSMCESTIAFLRPSSSSYCLSIATKQRQAVRQVIYSSLADTENQTRQSRLVALHQAMKSAMKCWKAHATESEIAMLDRFTRALNQRLLDLKLDTFEDYSDNDNLFLDVKRALDLALFSLSEDERRFVSKLRVPEDL